MFITTIYYPSKEETRIFNGFSPAKAWGIKAVKEYYFNTLAYNDREYEGRFDIFLVDDDTDEIIPGAVMEVRPAEWPKESKELSRLWEALNVQIQIRGRR